MRSELKGILAGFLAAILWGLGFIASDVALEYFQPLQTVGIRFLGAALLSLLLFYNIIRRTTATEFLQVIPNGVVLYLAFSAQTIGLQNTSVANNAFLSSLSVVFTPFIAWIIHRDKPSNKTFLGAFIALIGVSILSFSGFDFALNRGDLFSILSSIFFALQVVLVSKVAHIHFIKITFVQSLVAGLLGVFTSLFIEGPIPTQTFTVPRAVIAIAYVIGFSTLAAYLLQTYATQYIKPSLFSVIASTETIFATLFAYVFLDQSISSRTFLASIFILSAVLIMSINPEKKEVSNP